MRLRFAHASTLFLLTIILISSLSCASAAGSAMARPAGQAGPWTPTNVRNATRTQVREVLGAPGHVFNENVWVYFDYRAENVATTPGLDTLVVVFDREEVIGMKLADGRLIRELIARRTKSNEVSADPVISLQNGTPAKT